MTQVMSLEKHKVRRPRSGAAYIVSLPGPEHDQTTTP